MLAYRYVLTASTGIATIFSLCLPAVSQNSSDVSAVVPLQSEEVMSTEVAVTPESLNFIPHLEGSSLLWSSLPEFRSSPPSVSSPFGEVSNLAQSLPTVSPPERVPLERPLYERLKPSSNPLLFPTQPSDVEIDVVEPLTLEQALDIARSNNQDLQVARLNVRASEANLQQALAELYPVLSTRADFVRNDQANPQSRSGNLSTPIDTVSTTLNTTLELSYDLYTGGRRPALIEAAEEQLRFNLLDLERVSEQIRFEVATRYYDLQESDALVDVAQAALADARQSLRDALLLEEAGLGTRFDVLRAEVEVANANQDVQQAIADQFIDRRALVEVLALGEEVTVTAADPIDKRGDWELSLPESIVQAYQNRAELRQQLVQRNINEKQQQIALADGRPQVSLFTNYNLLDVVDDSSGVDDGLQLGARLQWTLYAGGAIKARAEEEEANIAIAETQFDNQRNEVRLQVERAYYQLQASEENIDTAAAAVELAEESLRLARLRFQAGVGTQTDVISAQSELTSARANLVRAVINYNRALAALRRAVSNFPDNILFDRTSL